MIDFRSGREPKSSSFDYIAIRIASPEEIRGPRDPKERERLELQGPNNYYVVKLEKLKPGIEPVVALVRYAVIDGMSERRVEKILPTWARLGSFQTVGSSSEALTVLRRSALAS